MKLVMKIIFVVVVLVVIAANSGAQDERGATFDYRKILIAAYARQEQPPAKEERRSGQGPEYLPAIVQGPASDLPSDAELEARRGAGSSRKPRVVPKSPHAFSLAELSQFLGEGESSVILPKGAVIHCPEALTAKLLTTPGGKVMPWPEFLIAHRAWVTTREVSQEQIRGEAAFTDSDRASFLSGGKLVVATFRGNPVTVLTPVPTPP